MSKPSYQYGDIGDDGSSKKEVIEFKDLDFNTEVIAKYLPEKEDLDAHQEYLTTTILKTDLPYIDYIYGWRPTLVHGIMAPKGSGKSTFTRTCINDLLKNGYKVMAYLSEDRVLDYGVTFRNLKFDREQFVIIEEQEKLPQLKQITISGASLKDQNSIAFSKMSLFFKLLEKSLHQEKPDILFVDNLTSSGAYFDVNTEAVQAYIAALKQLAVSFNIPLVYLIHTRSENAKIPYSPDDVRGNKKGAYSTEILGALYKRDVQTDSGEYHTRSCVHWVSNRSESNKDYSNNKFCLLMNPTTRIYDHAWEMNGAEFNKWFVNKIDFKEAEGLDFTDEYEMYKQKFAEMNLGD